MESVDLALVKEALELLDTGLSKLMLIESSNAGLLSLLDKVHSAVQLGEKLVSVCEAA